MHTSVLIVEINNSLDVHTNIYMYEYIIMSDIVTHHALETLQTRNMVCI